MESTNSLPISHEKIYNLCICCGFPLEKGKKRYCSPACREDFVFKLKWFNNLLRAVNTKYATFFFNSYVLGLNVLPFDSEEVYSFFYKRTPTKKPVYDMEKMVFLLGDMWWERLRNTGNRDGATRGLLSRGIKQVFSKHLLTPKHRISPSGISKDLPWLKINKKDLLLSDNPHEVVKKAFKRSVLRHHPDMGGDEESFIRVYNSYQNIVSWLKNPRYASRRGVVGHWCFEAGRSNWYSPL